MYKAIASSLVFILFMSIGSHAATEKEVLVFSKLGETVLQSTGFFTFSYSRNKVVMISVSHGIPTGNIGGKSAETVVYYNSQFVTVEPLVIDRTHDVSVFSIVNPRVISNGDVSKLNTSMNCYMRNVRGFPSISDEASTSLFPIDTLVTPRGTSLDGIHLSFYGTIISGHSGSPIYDLDGSVCGLVRGFEVDYLAREAYGIGISSAFIETLL